ncbi:tetratricopeptide repeat protein [Actinomadura miaoliensis]|uniref:non-specific serine/threonine protein kinase n=1 Tax=Actinomadura miaoliensis TaxID=430685 RepID=A0ABP7VUS1_9ACTN
MIQCTAPGCGGTVEDGYCVECGLPPAPAPQAAPAAPAGDACTQPGCTGTIEDGYCDTCGLPPAPASPAALGTPPSDACTRQGCTGTIQDGYCDTCGLPPAAPAGPTAASGRTAAPSAPTRGSSSTRTGMGTSTGRTGSTRGSGRRGQLGAGLVEVPRVPYRDPATAVLPNPEVAEHKRYCGNCGDPVGRSRGDRPGRTEGFCAKCGTGFSFTPKLRPGDLVGGQYEVLGCLAHGGLGWIYLAKDRNVSDRWVVLKGLLDTGDADALAAAAAERAFLAEVEHPNIVKIYNFVQHPDPATGAPTGYIVMEYVGGRSLKDILLERRRLGEDALPLGQAIAYALEALQAFGYLHTQRLLYCDFKPDNVIQSEEQLRLIDLGAVRRLDDQDGAIYGTVGYQAPEIADDGPSISSDLYTVGRALAVLSFPFAEFTTTYATSLPPREQVPVLARHESFDRFLRRATHRDPALRFQDAAEMAEQLTGVLREVLAAEDGRPRPAPSALFGPERFAAGVQPGVSGDGAPLPTPTPRDVASALPVPLVDGADPAAGFLAGLTALEPRQLMAALGGAPERTPEVALTGVRVRIELGRTDDALRLLDDLAGELSGDWRLAWYRAVATLARERVDEAAAMFDDLYGLLPGEAAPKLALAFCREGAAPDDAARLYEAVWRTDDSYINAAFGLARVRLAGDDRAAAVAVLDSVPQTSIRHVAAQLAAVTTIVRGRLPSQLTAAELVGAGDRLAALDVEGERRERLEAEVLEAALSWVRHAPKHSPQEGSVLGAKLTEPQLRSALERTYRSLARHSADREERRLLIDRANIVRPRTLL